MKALEMAEKEHEREHRERREAYSDRYSDLSTDGRRREQAANNILSKYLYLEAREDEGDHLVLPAGSKA